MTTLIKAKMVRHKRAAMYKECQQNKLKVNLFQTCTYTLFIQTSDEKTCS